MFAMKLKKLFKFIFYHSLTFIISFIIIFPSRNAYVRSTDTSWLKCDGCAKILRRSKNHTYADIHFEESMVANVAQKKLLYNETNKIHVISMLKKKF